MEHLPLLSHEDEIAERLQPVILGADFSVYAFGVAFWQRWHITSIVLATADVKVISSSRFFEVRLCERLCEEKVFLKTLKTLGASLYAQGKRGYLIASGDYYTELCARYREELSAWFYVTTPAYDLVERLSQKELFYQICDELAIPHPDTYVLSCHEDAQLPQDFQLRLPCMLKASHSAEYSQVSFPGKKKVNRIDTVEGFHAFYQAIKASQYHKNLIVQEFIDGADESMYALYGYANAESKVVAYLCAHVGLEDRSPTALGNAVVMAPADQDALRLQTERFVAHVGYTGLFCIDVRYDATTDTYKFLEINPRAGRSSMIWLMSGINMAELGVREHALGQVASEVRPTCTDWVYTTAPRFVIRHFMPASAFKEELLSAWKQGRVRGAISHPQDTLAHAWWAWVTYCNQILKFYRYSEKK